MSPSQLTPVVSVKGLTVAFDTPHGRKEVVEGVSFEVAPGEVLGVLGESGSGKTMSTQSILGLVDGYPGVVGGAISLTHAGVTHELLADLPAHLYERRGVTQKRDRAWQRRSRAVMTPLWGQAVTAIFQNPRRSLDPLMTVGEQLVESLAAATKRGAPAAAEELRAEALRWLERVQMVNPPRVFESYPHELSGGMCQRAMIAVALACKPTLLVADEPTTGLDATVRAQVVSLLRDLVRQESCAMLYISHDIREVLFLTDRVIVMRHGQVIERANTADLRAGVGERHPYTRSLLDASGLVERVGEPAQEPAQELTQEPRPLLLRARDLNKAFQGRDGSVTRAIDRVDLDLHRGEVVALIGESGSGKTTLGRALTRLLQLDSGEIALGGEDLRALGGGALREARRGFQMIFQNQQANLHPNLSVRQMLDESLRLHQPALTAAERLERARALLARVGLKAHEERYVASLSGGEQRRVGLARILATSPALIVADEPTSGLDAAIKLQIIDLLKEVKGADLTYLLISHDLGLVRKIADRVLVMLRGRVIEEVPIADLGARPHHPYTEKLLAAAELGDRELTPDAVSVEDVEAGALGCSYASVCPLARAQGLAAQCAASPPPFAPHPRGGGLACFGMRTDA